MDSTTNHHFVPQETVQRLLEVERAALEAYRAHASSDPDPAVRSVFAEAAELRARYYEELESRMTSIRANEAITRDLNEMFW